MAASVAAWSFPFTKGASIGARDSRGDPQGSISMRNAWVDPDLGIPASRPPFRRFRQNINYLSPLPPSDYPYDPGFGFRPVGAVAPRGYFHAVTASSETFTLGQGWAWTLLVDDTRRLPVILTQNQRLETGLSGTTTLSGTATSVLGNASSLGSETSGNAYGRRVAFGPSNSFLLVYGQQRVSGANGGVVEYSPGGSGVSGSNDDIRGVGFQDQLEPGTVNNWTIGSNIRDIAFQAGRLWALSAAERPGPGGPRSNLRWTSAGGGTFDPASGGGVLAMTAAAGSAAGRPTGIASLGSDTLVVSWENAVQTYRVASGGDVVPAPTGTLSSLSRVDELAGVGTRYPQCLLAAGDSVLMLGPGGLFRFSSEVFKDGLDIQPLSPKWNETAKAWYNNVATTGRQPGSLWVQPWRTAIFFALAGNTLDRRTAMLIVQFPEDGEAVVSEWTVGYTVQALFWMHLPMPLFTDFGLPSTAPHLIGFGQGRFVVLGAFPDTEQSTIASSSSVWRLEADEIEVAYPVRLESSRLPLGGEGFMGSAKRVTVGLAHYRNIPRVEWSQGEFSGVPFTQVSVGVAYSGSGGTRIERLSRVPLPAGDAPQLPITGQDVRVVPWSAPAGGTSEAMSIVVQSQDARRARFGVQWAAVDFTKGGRAVRPNR
ncbi:hypothetical protein UFOVP411_48 [uncultured Caudovirales phage]|uniref:Uncharacterized protein n=1 Tax=uncultured Caudovirales phage TaxID=2100421 RepID=A0A6J5M7I8_9CAUD|nr:hypothetical protein UFOVP411_48 [uncultured Caudovirales phage]